MWRSYKMMWENWETVIKNRSEEEKARVGRGCKGNIRCIYGHKKYIRKPAALDMKNCDAIHNLI